MAMIGATETLLGICLLVPIGLALAMAFFLYNALERLPERHRAIHPAAAWLTIIPFAGIVFAWILLPFRIPDSYRSYFSAHPIRASDLGDYGKSLGMATMILFTLCLVPFVNILACIPALVLVVVYLVKLDRMAKLVLPEPPVAPKVGADSYDALLKLKALLDQGALTQVEFDAQKRRILES